MKRLTIFGIVVFLLAIAIVCGYYLGISTRTAKEFNWRMLTVDPNSKGYVFSSEALFNSDIRLPNIKDLSGRYKFLNTTKDDMDKFHLGYIVSVDVEKLNIEEIPQKYKVDRKENYKAGEFIVSPIEEVVYQIYFEFALKDKDGFKLVKLTGPKHYLSSNKTNRFQDKVVATIAGTVVDQTKDVSLEMTVQKCETCK